MKTHRKPHADCSSPSYGILIAALVFAQETAFYDSAVQHMPKDGIVTLYAAGGPNTAFQKVADVWQAKT